MMKRTEQIKERILDAGLALWPASSLRSIGRAVEMTHSAVLYHFGTSDALNAAIRAHAVAKGNSAIIVQLIATNDPAVAEMTKRDRSRHMAAV